MRASSHVCGARSCSTDVVLGNSAVSSAQMHISPLSSSFHLEFVSSRMETSAGFFSAWFSSETAQERCAHDSKSQRRDLRTGMLSFKNRYLLVTSGRENVPCRAVTLEVLRQS